MNCPACGHEDTGVIDSRPRDEGATLRRRRRCAACEHRFTTFEREMSEATGFVLKRDGRLDHHHADQVDELREIFAGMPAADRVLLIALARRLRAEIEEEEP